jgi:transcription elongation factor GreA
MKPLYLSKDQFEKLSAELTKLKREDRPQVIKAIKEARELGDLKENAEYAAAKEKQQIVERKIGRLEETLSRARIMTDDMLQSAQVMVGNKIKLFDVANNEELVYELVPTAEFNSFDPNAVSIDSPVGKALLGKSVGDTVEIKVPAGILKYKVVEIF